jgi:hypothetical protein
MKKTDILFIAAFVMNVGVMSAQQNSETKHPNIFETLAAMDSSTHATVKIHQDKRIEKLFASNKKISNSQDQSTSSGFRVQVFSSNTQRTAKGEAFKIEKQIKEEFPNQEVYVNYTSPFWKVRVGDFRTQSQAQIFRNELISAFPYMRSETYIVREQILISGSK